MENRIDGAFRAPASGLDIDHAPPRSGPELFVLRLKANETKTLTIFSEAIWGMWVHFDQRARRSSPHWKDEKCCPGCIGKHPKRWKGFLHAGCAEAGQQVFLELTPHSANSILNQLGNGVSLRGNRIHVKRTKSNNGRLVIAVLPAHGSPQLLPPAKDPLNTLMNLWGHCPQGDLGDDKEEGPGVVLCFA